MECYDLPYDLVNSDLDRNPLSAYRVSSSGPDVDRLTYVPFLAAKVHFKIHIARGRHIKQTRNNFDGEVVK